MCNTCGGPIKPFEKIICWGSQKQNPLNKTLCLCMHIYQCRHHMVYAKVSKLMPSGHRACYYYPLVHVACIRKHHALALSTGTRSRIVPLLARNKASSLVRYRPSVTRVGKTTPLAQDRSGKRSVLKGILKYLPIHATLATL